MRTTDAVCISAGPHPPTPPPAEGEEPAFHTTDEAISDYASHVSVDYSEDIHLSPVAPSPSHTHSPMASRKEEGKGGRPLLQFGGSSDEEELDFDSDISGLLSDGDYVPSSALGTVSKARGSAHPFVSDISSGGLSGGVASREGTPLSNPVSSGNLQDRPSDLQCKPSDLQDKPGDLQCKPSDLHDKPGDLQRKPSDLQDESGDLQCKPRDLQDKPGDLQHKPSDLQDEPGDLQCKPSDLQDKSINLQDKPSDLQGKPSGLQGKPRKPDLKADGPVERYVHWWINSIPYSALFSRRISRFLSTRENCA